MKILHTADWHAGRVLKGVDRTPEIAKALQEVAQLAIEEQVDLILISGDLFDKKNPSALAEKCVYEFFLTIAKANIPSVAIAGNHDASSRLEAISGMLKLTGAHVFGDVRLKNKGGTFELTINDETAQIAALPFISERRIVRYADLLEDDEGKWLEVYREGMRKLIGNLTQDFQANTINLLLLHSMIDGASLSNSEYKFHCTRDYSLDADMLPESANYIALGHVHKTQKIAEVQSSNARYSGSLIQLNFAEAGDKKYVFVVEAKADKPARLIKQHEIKAGKPLKQVKITEDKLEGKLKELQDFYGWLKLIIKLEKPVAGLKDKIIKTLPNVLDIDLKFPERTIEVAKTAQPDPSQIELSEAYEQFYQEEKGHKVPIELLTAFRELIESKPL